MSIVTEQLDGLRMALGMEVVLGPGNIVLDGDRAPVPQKGDTALPIFWPISTVPKRLDSYAT